MSDTHITLPEHEMHSEARAEKVEACVEESADRVIEAVHQQCAPSAQHHEAPTMSEHGMSDKVEVKNIFEPGRSGGGMGEGGLASALPLLLAGRADHGGFGMGGFGAGLVGGVLGGALFGGRRGGFLGGGDDCGGGGAETRVDNTIFSTAVLTKLGSIEAAIPLASAQSENVTLQQTNALTAALGSLALGVQQSFTNTNDTTQRVGALNLAATNNVNQNVLEQGCQTRAAVAAAATAILQKIDQNTIDDLRHRAERNERQVDINALRSQIEITNTNTATATQAQGQAQFQFQLQDVNNRIARLCDLVAVVHQEARATNNNVIAGNTGAVTTGAQTSTASPTSVNT